MTEGLDDVVAASDVGDADDVVVLGAGVAGLACARALGDAGLRVAVVEARPRVGGRILTRRDEGAPLPAELGAEFVHGSPRELMALLDEAGIEPVPAEESFWTATAEGLRPSPRYETDLDAVLDAMDAEREPDRSFADFLAAWQREHPGHERAARRARDFVEGFHAADPARASERALAHETEASEREGGDEEDFRLPGGYDRVPAWLRSRLSARVRLRLGTVATAVRWSRGRVEVDVRADGGAAVLRARALVVTLPLGVLQAPAGEDGAVAFAPEPPGKRDALAGLAMGDARRVVLHFAEPWWERDGLRAPDVREPVSGMGFLQIPDAPIPIWWTSAPLRAPVLTGWLGGPRATRAAGLPHDALRELALDTLADGLRVPRAELARLLRAAHGHDWAADPFARGAYSYALVGAGDARRRLAAPIDGTLFWAGEATHADGSAGTVHGALASGQRAAAEVVAALG